MASRYEITRKCAFDYRRADQKEKGRVLDQVCDVTSWSRINARRRLVFVARAPAQSLQVVENGEKPRTNTHGPKRKTRSKRYSDCAVPVLVKIWAWFGFMCGKYLRVSMPALLENLEAYGVLVIGCASYSQQVKNELLSMSEATIDRYLREVKVQDQIKGLSGTKPGNTIGNLIPVRKAGDGMEKRAGFLNVTLSHIAGRF